MKFPLLLFVFACSFAGNAQYFNIFPLTCTADGNQFHYEISGVENFSDSLTLVLNVELLTNDEQLDLITNRVFDLSDSTSIASGGLILNAPDNTFALDLGNFPVNNYIVHMWIALAGERFDEIYYQQP